MAISWTLAKDRDRHPLKAPCLHLSQIGTSIVKKLKERALSLPGKLPAPSILANFALRFGSGSPLPLIIAWFDGYLSTSLVRACRQKYWSLTRSGPTRRHTDSWRRMAAISSNVLCMYGSSTSNWFPQRAIHSFAQPVLYKVGPLILSSIFWETVCQHIAHGLR